MGRLQTVEDLQSYSFLTKIMTSPAELLRHQGSLYNEIYLALLKHIISKHREVWAPAKYFENTILKQLISEVIPYFEGLFGQKMPEEIEIKLVPREALGQSIYQVTLQRENKVKKFVKISRKKLGDLAPYLEPFRTSPTSYQIPFFKVKKPLILIPQDQPIWVSVMTLPHELFHAYINSLVYHPPWSYQTTLREFSTSEYCAEVMGAKFLSEEYGLKIIFGEPIGSYEYTLYKLDYLIDKKDSLKFIKGIMNKEYLYDNEVFYRFQLEHLSKLSKAWFTLFEATILKGSFIKYKSLQHAVSTDYGIIYNILNTKKIREMYKDLLDDENADFYRALMNIKEFKYKPYDLMTDRIRILLFFSEKIRKNLIHYIPPDKSLTEEDIKTILKVTQFGNPDPRKHPDYYKNKYRVKGLFEYFAYEPAVVKKKLKYKDFWQDPREVV